LVLHPWQSNDVRTQWNPESLSAAICLGEFGAHVSFNVNPLALHQGFYLFKKALTLLSHLVVPMGGKKGVMNIASFMDLPERSKGLNIVFVWEERGSLSHEEVLERVLVKANYLLTNTGFGKSRFSSLAELGCHLWQQSMIVRPDVEVESTCKRRKTASELGSKMLSSYGKQINEYVTTTLCLDETDSSTLYLEAAMKESYKDLSNLDSVSKKIFSDETVDTLYSEVFAKVMQDQRVVDSLSLYPKKNIVFSSDEKDLVLCLFDVIMKVMIEDITEDNPRITYLAATVTKKILAKHPIFSELIVSTIERWHENRGTVTNKPGKKIYQNFEAEIWGKLLIFEFENQVVSVQLFSSLLLFLRI
jgi:hypothetical protein